MASDFGGGMSRRSNRIEKIRPTIRLGQNRTGDPRGRERSSVNLNMQWLPENLAP